jgi:ABC-type uncharacterized transport system substrate-binding protein
MESHAIRRWTASAAALCLLAGCSVVSDFWERTTPPVAHTASQTAADTPGPDAMPPRPARIAILLSEDVATYRGIAAEITRRGRYNEYLILDLAGNAVVDTHVRLQLQRFEADKFVAIGLPAAQAVRGYSDLPMVFCQVFNYRDHDLPNARSKGVKLLPPFALQIEIWREITPELRAVGVITGPNQDELLDEMRRAAAQHRVELLVRTVTTDKDALFEFKQLTPQIQGFWLLPDNRVLSPRVLREMLSYGNKHGNQTAVFNRQLLNLGADISFTSSEGDIADAVLSVLGGGGSKNILFGPPMTPLKTVRAAVDPDLYATLRARGSAPAGLEEHVPDD